MKLIVSLFLFLIIHHVKCVNILAVFPFPSISHQVVFRKITLELVNRGHHVTVITTDPAFPKGQGPANLREIDVHDISYDTWRSYMENNYTVTDSRTTPSQVMKVALLFTHLFDKQLEVPEIQNLLFNEKQKFDLILIECLMRPAVAVSHVFKAPVIMISSFGLFTDNSDIMGLTSHPVLYPSNMNKRIYNLTLWEKLDVLYKYFSSKYVIYLHESNENALLQKHFGPNIPSMSELLNNVDMILVNVNSIWADNQPVSQNVVYIGGIHQLQSKPLPKDLQNYLDSSKNGVIYVSFGTNVLAGMMPAFFIENLVKVLSQLPYDILWKWDKDELPGKSNNIKLSKWLPQADLLKHPKVKLFITQGGLQSTDEAITAGVPLIAFPMFGDQWYNAEKYVYFGIGKYILLENLTEDLFKDAVETVINNKRYRENMVKLRTIIQDQPEKPLERSMWWIEYVIRHGGAKHLRNPAADISWYQYYEIELVLIVSSVIFISLAVFVIIVVIVSRVVINMLNNKNKLKTVKNVKRKQK